MSDISPFQRHESEVRSYCRTLSGVFDSAHGAIVRDENGRSYIDFLSGAGVLNYGHNHPSMTAALEDYLARGGIVHSLDLHTKAKRSFLQAFNDVILEPRNLDYKIQFTGPTGTNAVEAAVKLARKVTGRAAVAAFTNGFHGMTLGALSATGSKYHRGGNTGVLPPVVRLPFESYLGNGADSIALAEKLLDDPSSGVDLPAAVIVETVQGEGGLNVASAQWLRRLESLCRSRSILLIVDDVQAGCGRTGQFFSFERAGITPDLVCLSKGLSGFGLPLAVLLIRPSLDHWLPGEHNGTFRGNNLAFVTATSALEFWRDPQFEASIADRSKMLGTRLTNLAERFSPHVSKLCGLGMMQGVSLVDPDTTQSLCERMYRLNVLIETCGPHDEVLKFIPPLTIETDLLAEGLSRLEQAMEEVFTTAPAGRAHGDRSDGLVRAGPDPASPASGYQPRRATN